MRRFSVIGSGGSAVESKPENKHKRWTAEDDALLLAGYEAKDSREAIAAALGRTKQAVSSRKSELDGDVSVKTDKATRHRKHWRKRDKMKLRELVAKNTPLAEIALAVGRSERATQEAIYKLSKSVTRKATPAVASHERRLGKALLVASPAIAALVAFAIAMQMGWLP